MIIFGQLMGTQALGFLFMVLIIGGPIYAVIHEIFFRDAEPKPDCRPGQPY